MKCIRWENGVKTITLIAQIIYNLVLLMCLVPIIMPIALVAVIGSFFNIERRKV